MKNKRALLAVLFAVALSGIVFADDDDSCTTTTYSMNSFKAWQGILDYNDVDWFKATANGQRTIHVVLAQPEHKNYYAQIYDSCGGSPVSTCALIREPVDCYGTVTDDFYVKVYQPWNEGDPAAPYVIAAGSNDACELVPNDGQPFPDRNFTISEPIETRDFQFTNPYGNDVRYYNAFQLYQDLSEYGYSTSMYAYTSIPASPSILASSSTRFLPNIMPPRNGFWPNTGYYKHKELVVAYCPVGAFGVTALSSYSSPKPLVQDTPPPQPNLQVTALWTNITPYGGQPVKIYVNTSEVNGVAAPVSCTRLLADGNTLSAFCQSVSAGGSFTGYATVSLPVGAHNITAIADYWREITETDETDNARYNQINWQQPRHMNSQVENLRQRYYKNEAVQYDVYLTDQQNSTPLDGAYVTTLNPFTRQPDWQNTSQQGRYWFDWNATETGLKQFNLNSFKYGYYQKNNYRQVIVTPETARLYASVFDPNNRPVWGAKFKIDGEDRGAAGRNGQLVIPAERGDRRVQVSCPNNNACFDQNVYLNGNTERRFTCNCPDSTTNVVLNLTAFSDALPPNEEYISANGLPIANAMVSVDDEFESKDNTTDPGGMMAVKNIPYGFHDFDFYYCLERLENASRCTSIWHSYSRANIQQGTQYVNFALNVDAMRPQGNGSNFESFAYKDGKWVMTAGKIDSALFGIDDATLLLVAYVAITVYSLYDDIQKIQECNRLPDYELRLGNHHDCTMEYGMFVFDIGLSAIPGGVIPLKSFEVATKTVLGKEIKHNAVSAITKVSDTRKIQQLNAVKYKLTAAFEKAAFWTGYLALNYIGISILENTWQDVLQTIDENNKRVILDGEIIDKNNPIFKKKDGAILDPNEASGEEWRRIKEHYRILASQKQVLRPDAELLAKGATRFKPDFTVEKFVTIGANEEYKIFLNQYNEITVQENFGARNTLTSFDDLAAYTQKKFGLFTKNTLYILDSEGTVPPTSEIEELLEKQTNGPNRKKAFKVMEKYFESIGKPISARWHVISGDAGLMAKANEIRNGGYKELLKQKGVVIIDRAVDAIKAAECIFKRRCS